MLESQETVNIVEQRRKFLVRLKQRINAAYLNRSKETYIPQERSTAEMIVDAREERAKIEDEEIFIDTGKFTPFPNEVYVTNPHDYPDLIRMSLEKLADEGHFFRPDIPKTTRDILEHEYKHHFPALGQKGLRIRYSIAFLEDSNQNFVGISPAIILTGHFTVKLYKEIVNAPIALSITDKIRSD